MDSGDIWARMFQRARGEEVLTTHKPASVPSHTADKALACWLENPCPNENSARKFHSYLELARKGQPGAVIKVERFLPPNVAEGILNAFEAAPRESWTVAKAQNDVGKKEDGAGSVSHKYAVGDGSAPVMRTECCVTGKSAPRTSPAAAISGLQQAIQSLFPKTEGAFQAGRYTRGCFIAPHDDVAFKDVEDVRTGCIVRHEREVAVIYYLTKDWDADYGGCFVDLESGIEHVPQFNTLFAFKVPLLHEVTPLRTDRNRFSMFGWFYKPVDEPSSSLDNAVQQKEKVKVTKPCQARDSAHKQVKHHSLRLQNINTKKRLKSKRKGSRK
mmetsp:Transcript_33364/g.62776  ORF Transcript_33364/g.62776 Transcript_33364/m.62776 type:complete len:328 (+) Transcript_33364:204-1187(+)|eukprot:CAMPEP_0114294808 /NCGR_PEP_ID=MMETSP0059-20121206/10331_1 /TAXON_ID=36894 /ORGANISM="Pyramimonas parkeae, Strain CCMP726" /LENGTH=327 /DNA_ID=CAMNT_0001416625 /DNA_START=262 /DNA_END=1245 /DNA_ORIENTATION=+